MEEINLNHQLDIIICELKDTIKKDALSALAVLDKKEDLDIIEKNTLDVMDNLEKHAIFALDNLEKDYLRETALKKYALDVSDVLDNLEQYTLTVLDALSSLCAIDSLVVRYNHEEDALGLLVNIEKDAIKKDNLEKYLLKTNLTKEKAIEEYFTVKNLGKEKALDEYFFHKDVVKIGVVNSVDNLSNEKYGKPYNLEKAKEILNLLKCQFESLIRCLLDYGRECNKIIKEKRAIYEY